MGELNKLIIGRYFFFLLLSNMPDQRSRFSLLIVSTTQSTHTHTHHTQMAKHRNMDLDIPCDSTLAIDEKWFFFLIIMKYICIYSRICHFNPEGWLFFFSLVENMLTLKVVIQFDVLWFMCASNYNTRTIEPCREKPRFACHCLISKVTHSRLSVQFFLCSFFSVAIILPRWMREITKKKKKNADDYLWMEFINGNYYYS